MGRKGEKKPEAKRKNSDVDLETERLHEEEPDEGRRGREEDAEESE
jgi:hypothetical protein